jgi:hypothetical protein
MIGLAGTHDPEDLLNKRRSYIARRARRAETFRACSIGSDRRLRHLAGQCRHLFSGPNQSRPQRPKRQTQIVLLSQTSAGYPPGMAAFTASSTPEKKELLDSAATATKNDFDAKAKLNCDLTANAEVSAAVVFMSPKESDELFSKVSEWKDFAQKYPNAAGFTIVSAIAFDASHRQALVYVGNSCGMLCGTGYVVLLEKKKDKWIVAKTAKIWIAT